MSSVFVAFSFAGCADTDATQQVDAADVGGSPDGGLQPGLDAIDDTASAADLVSPSDTSPDTTPPSDTTPPFDATLPSDTADVAVPPDATDTTDTTDTTDVADAPSPTDTSDTVDATSPIDTADAPDPAEPQLPEGVVLINEVYANTATSGSLMTLFNPYTFVELVARPGTSLSGLALVGIDAEGEQAFSISLSGTVPDDGFYVIARADSHETIDAAADWHVNRAIEPELFSILVRRGDTVIDAIAFGDFRTGDVSHGEGAPAPAPGYNHSLSRDAASADTDDNASDFKLLRATPGAPNLAPRAPIARLACPDEVTLDTDTVLDGSASTDPDGTATWTFDLGDGRPRVENSTPSLTARWPLAAVYTVRLSATAPGIDGRDLRHDATCRIRVVAAARSSAWRSIAAGGRHSCGLRDDGTIWCWGANDLGQLGAGSNDGHSTTPRQVLADSGANAWDDWVELSVGGRSNLGIRADGTLWQWGDGVRRPAEVRGAGGGRPYRDWISVSAGDDFACGIRRNASLWCWGANTNGMLGDTSLTASVHPVQVRETFWRDWVSVSAGEQHACGTRPGGMLYCWGRNDGALGVGDSTRRTKPTQVDSAGGWAVVSAGWVHTCALKRDRTLHCWGKSERGELGFSVFGGIQDTPRAVTGNTWVTAESGYNGTCGLRTGGSLWCWGSAERGQRGDGVANGFPSEGPVRVLQAGAAAGSGLVWDDWVTVWPLFGFHDPALNRGTTHACAERADGTLYCWGAGGDGQRGDGSREIIRSTPVTVSLPDE